MLGRCITNVAHDLFIPPATALVREHVECTALLQLTTKMGCVAVCPSCFWKVIAKHTRTLLKAIEAFPTHCAVSSK